MATYDRLLRQILRGTSDASISLDELWRLLRHLGFEERIRGSHHIFRKPGIEETLNLQRNDGKAKEAIQLWIETPLEFGDPVSEPKGRRLM